MELIKANKIKEISDARDETGLDGFKLTFDLKRGVDPDALMLKLFKMTPLQDTVSCNFNILIAGMHAYGSGHKGNFERVGKIPYAVH